MKSWVIAALVAVGCKSGPSDDQCKQLLDHLVDLELKKGGAAATTEAMTTDASASESKAEVSTEVHATAPASDANLEPPAAFFTAELLGASPLDSGNRQFFGVGGGVGLGTEIYISPLLGIHGGAELVMLTKGGGTSAMASTTWVAGHVGPRLHFG